MSKPTKHERYSRVSDRVGYGDKHDAIFGKRPVSHYHRDGRKRTRKKVAMRSLLEQELPLTRRAKV